MAVDLADQSAAKKADWMVALMVAKWGCCSVVAMEYL